MELDAQVFEAERARTRQSWREITLKAELYDAEEREQKDDMEGGEHV